MRNSRVFGTRDREQRGSREIGGLVVLWMLDLLNDDRKTSILVREQKLTIRDDQNQRANHSQRSIVSLIKFSPKVVHLLKGLFVKNPKKRLGFAGAQ